MPQVIRIKRNVTSTAGPATLDPGELGYTGLGAVHNLYVGDGTGTVQNLVNPLRQVEIAGAQTITGVKTFDAVGKLNIIGGAVGAVLQSADPVTGALTFGPAVTAAQLFVGQFDGNTGIVTFTGTSGGTGPDLPAAGATNNGWYVIANVAGATPPVGSGVTGPFEVGDWLISNGTAWTHLSFGGTAVSTASDVGVVAPLTGPSVQDELESLVLNKVDLAGDTMTGLLILSGEPTAPLGAATKATVDTKVTGPATAIDTNVAVFSGTTGKLIADGGIPVANFGDVKGPAVAVDANVAMFSGTTGKLIADSTLPVADIVLGPAASVAQNVAVFADTSGTLLADGLIAVASFGDVKGPATAVLDRIASYADATGKVIKDGGILTSALGDVKGPAAAVDLNVAVFSGVTGKLIADGGMPIANFGDVKGPAASVADRVATYSDLTGKLIKDSGILATSLLTTVAVTAPELTGNGLVATPITFTGITIATNSTTSFTGNGLSTTPLDLVLVDGGTYA